MAASSGGTSRKGARPRAQDWRPGACVRFRARRCHNNDDAGNSSGNGFADWYGHLIRKAASATRAARRAEQERTLRGGSWYGRPEFVRASSRAAGASQGSASPLSASGVLGIDFALPFFLRANVRKLPGIGRRATTDNTAGSWVGAVETMEDLLSALRLRHAGQRAMGEVSADCHAAHRKRLRITRTVGPVTMIKLEVKLGRPSCAGAVLRCDEWDRMRSATARL